MAGNPVRGICFWASQFLFEATFGGKQASCDLGGFVANQNFEATFGGKQASCVQRVWWQPKI